MNPEKEQNRPRLTLLQSLLVSEIGRFQVKDGQSFMVLEAGPTLDEYFDENSPINEGREEPRSIDVIVLIVGMYACEVTINICDHRPGGRPYVARWPIHAQQLPETFKIRKQWDAAEIELDVAELAGLYQAQKSMSEEEIKSNPIFIGIPHYLEHILERQLAEAGYDTATPTDNRVAPSDKPVAQKQHPRTGRQRKPTRKLSAAPRAQPRKTKPVSTKN